MPKENLVTLFQRMADLTKPKCETCRVPLSCCDSMYCDMAERMIDEAGLSSEIRKTEHASLPYMGPSGCVVPPHLRPLCTLHVCSINGFGFDPKDPAFTRRYFRLRDKIEGNLNEGR
jgi:hypothetical protein